MVFYRSIFDTVRDFLHDEALDGQERILLRYLKPDLLIIDDMGMKQLPKRSGEYLFEIVLRRHDQINHDDQQPSPGGLGKAGRPQRHSDPGPVPASLRDHPDQRQELPLLDSHDGGLPPRELDDVCFPRRLGSEHERREWHASESPTS